MNNKLDIGYSATFERFSRWIANSENLLSNNLNETETRNKVIDPLFKDVMGWDETQLKREGYVNKIGYFDYEITCGSSNFILEAKREYVNFEMPVTNIVRANTLDSKYSDLKQAIFQGIDYAVSRGVEVVVVSNGTQIAVTYIPHVNNKRFNDTYLFQSHTKIMEDFIKFFNLFSPQSNIKEQIQKIINSDANQLIRSRPIFSYKINTKQANIGDIREDNNLVRFLNSLHNTFFNEIIDNDELLKKCYCDEASSHRYEKNIEFALKDRAPRLGKVIEDVGNNILDLKTSKKKANLVEGRFSESVTKMFLLIGGAGVGKTTFIHRFFKYILEETDKNSTVWIYLDCKECTYDTNIDSFVYEKIEDQLYENYKNLDLFENREVLMNIFSDELNKKNAQLSLLSEGDRNREIYNIVNEITENNKPRYISLIFKYIQQKEYSTCVIYDNVDQLSVELQKKLFLHGNSLEKLLRTMVIISLREEVYYQHKKDKTFNFSNCDVFHVPAPKIYNVLSKRLKVARESIKDNDVIFHVTNKNEIPVRVNKSDIIEVFTSTFLGDKENTLLLEMLSNKDIRESLKLFKKIISSPNVNFDDLITAAGINSISQLADKRIKYREILRGLALHNREHYSSAHSKIFNIFEVDNDGFFSHFTKIRILQYAQSNKDLRVGNLPIGFFKVQEMYEEYFKYTVLNLDHFIEICTFLQKEGALLNLKGAISSLEPTDFIILGPTGYYYLNNLKHNPYYLSFVAIDTPIADEKTVQKIEELYSDSLKCNEIKRNQTYHSMAKTFVNYLVDSEKAEIKVLKKMKCPNLDKPLYNISSSINECMNKQIEAEK